MLRVLWPTTTHYNAVRVAEMHLELYGFVRRPPSINMSISFEGFGGEYFQTDFAEQSVMHGRVCSMLPPNTNDMRALASIVSLLPYSQLMAGVYSVRSTNIYKYLLSIYKYSYIGAF